MKIVLVVVAILLLTAFVGLFVFGLVSQSGEASGITGDMLAKCPDKPNCVCSEFEDDASHYVKPMYIPQSDSTDALSRLKIIVQEMGGSIQTEKDNYLAATFTSSFFRFVDDLEIRIDLEQKLVHIRSASRVGYSDRGINKKRIEQFKKLFNMKLN